MQSHLTKRVFRAIVNNEPVYSSRCLYRLPYRPRNLPGLGLPRRSFFSFNKPPEQSLLLPSETGLKPMRDLMRAVADKSRAPASRVLANAFRDFFVTRSEVPHVITGFQARLLLVTWKHLQAQDELDPDVRDTVFSTESLETVLFVLSETESLSEAREPVMRLARFAFQQLSDDNGFDRNNINRPALEAYINLLSSNGRPDEAHHLVDKFWRRARRWVPSPWLAVMKGYAMKHDRRQLRRIIEELETRSKGFDRASHEELTKLLVEQDLWEPAKAIYECPISGGLDASLDAKKAVVGCAVLKSDLAWATPVFESLPQHSLAETMDVNLLWGAAHGKSPSDLSEEVNHWIADKPELEASLTVSCVNNLIRYANTIEDSHLGAGFAALLSRWHLEPNMQTHLLLLESRVMARDAQGTLESVRHLNEFGAVAFQNAPLVNRLIRMLCALGQDDEMFDHVSSLLDPVFEINVRLEPDTIAALTRMLLQRHDIEAASELLRPRLGSLESEGRDRVRSVLVDFIRDYSHEAGLVWEAYGLLKIAFPETAVSERTDVMTSFFKRGRSDLACLVFGHMRQAEELAKRPKPDTYAKCFQGIARAGDAQNLELVHNMLKLDVEVDLNTRILNGLMLAHASCEMPEKAMEIFRDILHSDEGPSAYTLAIFFKACETHHNGTTEAIKMMRKLKGLEMAAYRRVYTSYVEALGAQGEFDFGTEAIDTMQGETGYAPTRNT